MGYNSLLMLYDLHSHSLASDGSLAPAELVRRARKAGVDVLALTDHDETDGIAEASAAADAVGLELIPGVEISVTWNRMTVHIVGLRIDPKNPTLLAGLARLREFRNWRAEEIGRRLAKAGIEGAYEAAAARAKGRIVSRTHFAAFLADAGHARDIRDVFRNYLKRNKPGHVPGQWASLEEAVGWIQAAGGEAVIAHPARYDMTMTRLRKLAGEFLELGGTGIEVVSGSHSRDDCFKIAQLARQTGLLASSGSDYHGPENAWLELGRLPPLPEGCKPIWDLWDGAATQTRATNQQPATGNQLP